ncbi:MAG: ABC transporter substrate-binding protein [bacterium]
MRISRVLFSVVLCAILILAVASVSSSQKKYGEAPILADLVRAGKLPPVEKRLPEEPLVVKPAKEIGRYGGTIRTAHTTVYRWIEVASLTNWETMLKVSSEDYSTIFPNVARAWEFSKDKKTLTMYLRKGMRWSDGHPFTADDIIFWYEDVILSKELTPVKPAHWSPGGKLMGVEKVDDYTVRLNFSIPYPTAPYQLVMSGDIFLPKHYLEKYHPNYTPLEELEKAAKAAGYDSWWKFFQSKTYFHPTDARREVDAPTLTAYVVKEKGVNVTTLERNPYYWKVDPEGNQLPYIDKIQVSLLENVEVYNMKITTGEMDYADYNTGLENYPLYEKNAEKGGYRVLLWPSIYTSGVTFMPNLNHKDPVLRKILQDRRFRMALSLAINRDEINEIAYLGLGTPMQTTVLPPSSLYKEEFAKAYIEYNPGEANRLLDEMGLKWDRDHKYRLRPDGKTLAIIIEYSSAEHGPIRTSTCELVQKYWEDVGVKTALKPEASELFTTRVAAAEHDVGLWQTLTPEIRLFWLIRDYVPTQPTWSQWGTLWAEWYTSGGRRGEEPPGEIKELYKLWETVNSTTDEGAMMRALEGILRSQAENLWTISTVGLFPQPIIVNKNLANVPEKVYWGWDYKYAGIANPETWFFKR